MRLRARRELTSRVNALNMTVHFDEGEELRTEISAKFTPERIEGDLAAAGLELAGWFTDPQERFALTLSRAAYLRLPPVRSAGPYGCQAPPAGGRACGRCGLPARRARRRRG